MALITEAIARKKFDKENNLFLCSKQDKLTPSAKEFFSDKNITIKFIEDGIDDIVEKTLETNEPKTNITKSDKKKYICKYSGGVLEHKPEHMTSLYDNILVYKFDKRVELRGKLDCLQAEFINSCSHLEGNKEFIADLHDLVSYVRKLLICEYTNKPFDNIKLLDLDEQMLREYSHNPKKYFNSEHLFGIDLTFNKKTITLNYLRTKVREVEIFAVKTFFTDGVLEREDIIKALNRLSSGVYIAMLKAESGVYE